MEMLQRGAQPLQPSVPSIPFIWFPPYLEEGIQTEEQLGYNPAPRWLQEFNQAGSQLECELSEETQKLACKYKDQWISLQRKQGWNWTRMAQEEHTTFQVFFSMTCSTNSVQLLPWCISFGIPFCYMDDSLASTAWQGGDASATTAAPMQEEPTALGPSSSSTHLMETPPPIVPLSPNLPIVGTPQWGTHSFSALLALYRQKWDHSPSGFSVVITVRGPMFVTQRWRLGVSIAHHRVIKLYPN